MTDSARTTALPDPTTEIRFYRGATTKRLLAFVIDVLVAAALGAAATLLVGVATLGVAFLLALPVMAATDFLYRWASIARWSATPGMALLGVELRRADGRPLDMLDALAHTTLYWIFVASGILQLVSVAMMAATPQGRGLHDAILGTVLINRPA